MKGYYKNPEATAEVIDKDNFLHSGDLGIKDEDGNYRITGRIKDMIIRGGENIYPREIEEFLYKLEKYKDNPYCMDKGTLLPVPCNQKMNSYLKEIADLCGIKKKLTTHTARHSFASVIALANNVSLPNVAKMLGHSSTRMTQHYAKVLDQTILRDMQEVEKQINNLHI